MSSTTLERIAELLGERLSLEAHQAVPVRCWEQSVHTWESAAAPCVVLVPTQGRIGPPGGGYCDPKHQAEEVALKGHGAKALIVGATRGDTEILHDLVIRSLTALIKGSLEWGAWVWASQDQSLASIVSGGGVISQDLTILSAVVRAPQRLAHLTQYQATPEVVSLEE